MKRKGGLKKKAIFTEQQSSLAMGKTVAGRNLIGTITNSARFWGELFEKRDLSIVGRQKSPSGPPLIRIMKEEVGRPIHQSI